MWERPGDVTRQPIAYGFGTALVLFVARPLWAMRVELGLLASVVGVWVGIAGLASAAGLPSLTASLVVVAGLVGLSACERSRNVVQRTLHHASVRRSFDRACRYALVVSPNDRTPQPKSIRSTPAGEELVVQMPPGLSTLPLVDACEVLAANLGVREVRVARDADRADRATVSIFRRDPLGVSQPVAWPWMAKATGSNSVSSSVSIWDPIPVGVDELGEVVTISLPERNVLVAGEPGSGKSVSTSMLVAAAALDPGCDLYLFDGKQVELSVWAPCASVFVGPSHAQAISTLETLQREMDRRYSVLLAGGARKLSRDGEMRPVVVVFDELAYFLTMGDRTETKDFERRMRDLVARGRAAGIITIAATQRPSHDIVPTSLRELFGFRWAHRCTTPQGSDIILGSGWASRGFSASSIDAAARGVGLLLVEGGEPQRLRSYCLSDEDLVVLAERARQLRHPAENAPPASEDTCPAPAGIEESGSADAA